MPQEPLGRALWSRTAVVGSVLAITALHYITSLHSVLLHEVFQRLYYLPIVTAGVIFGWRAALATSLLATVLYVPHVLVDWHAWPVLQVGQYGEVLVFNLVGLVTGLLADRMRHERNRYCEATKRLESMHEELVAGIGERIRMDRLVTIGRVASGIAHEIRNPLGALLGCLEILAPAVRELPGSKGEFLSLAREEVARLDKVVAEFLEFAHPAPPSPQRTDLRELVATAVRLAGPNLVGRGMEVVFTPGPQPQFVTLDAGQLLRALLNLLLDPFAPGRSGMLRLSLDSSETTARICVDVPGVPHAKQLAGGLFDPFPQQGNGHGLSLAVAHRLIENQGGGVRAEAHEGRLRYVIDLPLVLELEPAATRPTGNLALVPAASL